jgi:DNA-binding transcriptional ArsR family regulator
MQSCFVVHGNRNMQSRAPYASTADADARSADGVGAPAPSSAHDAHWTFLTNHAHVLRVLAADPDVRVRDLAALVGVTERAALRILHDLEMSGYVERERVGRRTHYRLQLDQAMRHPMERGLSVATLLHALKPDAG